MLDGMPEFEVVKSEDLRIVKVTLNGDTVRSESGALHYLSLIHI